MIELISESGRTEYYFTVAETAKLVAVKDSKGKLLARNRFMEVLRHNGVVYGKINMPNQSYLNLGLCKFHTTVKNGRHVFPMVIFSEKGITYLKDCFKSGRYVVEFKKHNSLSVQDAF